jgi:zinc and cadmium transporter
MAVLLALSTMVSTSIGGLVALRHRDQLHLILGFAAGVMLGLVAFDLLPEVFSLGGTGRTLNLPTVALPFVAGFLILHLVERSVAMHHAHEGEYGEHTHVPQLGVVSAFALAGHSFMDGVGIGLAFKVGSGLGLAVALAVIAHDFADGLNTVTLMLRHGNGQRRARMMLALDAVAPVLGAASTLLFSVPEQVLALYLAFFAGFLLYLATGDILPEAHSRHPTRLTLVATVGGVAFIGGVVALS